MVENDKFNGALLKLNQDGETKTEEWYEPTPMRLPDWSSGAGFPTPHDGNKETIPGSHIHMVYPENGPDDKFQRGVSGGMLWLFELVDSPLYNHLEFREWREPTPQLLKGEFERLRYQFVNRAKSAKTTNNENTLAVITDMAHSAMPEQPPHESGAPPPALKWPENAWGPAA